MMKRADVAILGGGLAGLTLALHLRRMQPDLSVTILEKRPFPVPETTFKIGESMVEVSSWYLREVLDLGEHLLDAHLPKLGLRFFMTEDDNRDLGRRPEYGLLDVTKDILAGRSGVRRDDRLHLTTYNVDRGRLENHLYACCRDAGVEIADRCKVADIKLGDPHRVSAGAQSTQARWVIDATGRAGLLARTMNLRRAQTHSVNAVWFRLDGRIDPDDWTAEPCYHGRTRPDLRWRSTNHLMGDGYWVWLIPLPSGATSVGIMADPSQHPIEAINESEKAMAWLREREPQLAEVACGLRLLDFRSMKTSSYRSLTTLSADRWALSGESAYFTDALYSPGGDFIAVGNTLIAEMIAAERNGDRLRLSILSKFGEQLLHGMFQHYIGLYRGSYGLMGNPGVMLQKVIWDTAVYFGYNVYLFRNGRLCDYQFHRAIREENARLESIQQRMMYRFKQNGVASRSFAGHFIDHSEIKPVQALYESSRDLRAERSDVRAGLAANLDELERFSSSIEELVA